VSGRLGDREHTRRRYAPDTWVEGEVVRGASVDTPFMGSVQPMRGKDREVLPEGIRSADLRKIYCDRGTLRTEDQGAGEKADEVVVDGRVYVVVHVDDSHELIPHDRAYLQKKQEGAT
jgi:hypothetical protein